MTLFEGIRGFTTKRRGWLIVACGLLLAVPVLQACEAHAVAFETDEAFAPRIPSGVEITPSEAHTEAERCCCTDAAALDHDGALYVAVVDTNPRLSTPDDASPATLDVTRGMYAGTSPHPHVYGSQPTLSALAVYLATRRLRL